MTSVWLIRWRTSALRWRSTPTCTASDVGDFNLGYVWQDGFFQQLGQDRATVPTGVLTAGSSLRLDRFLPTSLGITMPFGVCLCPEQHRPRAADRHRHPRLRSLESESRRVGPWPGPCRCGGQPEVVLAGPRLLDPLSLNAALTDGRSQSELSSASSNARAFNATYGLIPGRGGFGLNLGGLVDHLPGFLRKTQGGDALRRPFVNLAPTSVRLSSGLLKNESQLTSFGVPVERASDSLLPVLKSLSELWRNAAG